MANKFSVGCACCGTTFCGNYKVPQTLMVSPQNLITTTCCTDVGAVGVCEALNGQSFVFTLQSGEGTNIVDYGTHTEIICESGSFQCFPYFGFGVRYYRIRVLFRCYPVGPQRYLDMEVQTNGGATSPANGLYIARFIYPNDGSPQDPFGDNGGSITTTLESWTNFGGLGCSLDDVFFTLEAA